MRKKGFPINDLLRRKLQTSLTTATLTLSAGATLFLLLFSSHMGFNLTSNSGTLTLGLNAIFSQFLLFVEVLVFVVGAVLTSFIVYLMMAQRTRDFGLMKAGGCPNTLVAGYFVTELLIISFVGCVLGVVFGVAVDYAVTSVVFSSYTLPNLLFVPVVFFVFFILALFFGLYPVFRALKIPPIKAISPVTYYGLTSQGYRKALSRSHLSWRIAFRSLFRRQNATGRIIILLSVVFILLTVSIAGGLIAGNTTTTWVQSTSSADTIAIAHSSMENQYQLLLSKFTGAKETGQFDYMNQSLAISTTVIDQLKTSPAVSVVDSRLLVMEHVQEVGNFTVDPDTQNTLFVGDSRQGDALVVGVNPQELANSWSVKGRFLNENSTFEAVIGDSVSHSMYFSGSQTNMALSNPLVEGIRFQNTTFNVVGVCVDPLNNGFVTYVPIENLKNVTGIAGPNLVLVQLNKAVDSQTAINQIRQIVQAADPDLQVFDINNLIQKDSSFLSSTWQTTMLVPLFALVSATMCLVGYAMLSVDEQHQEFAILRAIGAKPKIIMVISAIQSAIVLLSSFVIGVSLGVIITLLILMTNPIITGILLLEIIGLLLGALIVMFVLSLYPAYRLAKTPILKIIT